MLADFWYERHFMDFFGKSSFSERNRTLWIPVFTGMTETREFFAYSSFSYTILGFIILLSISHIMDITSLLTSALAGGAAEKLATQLGVESTVAKKMIALGAPVLLSRLAKNASSPDGAAALYNTLDKHATPKKSITETDTTDGMKMLGHIFGADQEDTLSTVASEAGVSPSQAGGALAALAPILMGALGQQKASGGLDLGSLAGLLTQTTSATNKNSLMTSLATSLLDKNGDGQIQDDMLRMGVNWLKNKFMG